MGLVNSRGWTAGLALALIAALPAQAQITTGSIQGQVVDQQGGALPGVTVSARNAAIGVERPSTGLQIR